MSYCTRYSTVLSEGDTIKDLAGVLAYQNTVLLFYYQSRLQWSPNMLYD
jgi:hypothetical protein